MFELVMNLLREYYYAVLGALEFESREEAVQYKLGKGRETYE